MYHFVKGLMYHFVKGLDIPTYSLQTYPDDSSNKFISNIPIWLQEELTLAPSLIDLNEEPA